jgi:hypothetical protein
VTLTNGSGRNSIAIARPLLVRLIAPTYWVTSLNACTCSVAIVGQGGGGSL